MNKKYSHCLFGSVKILNIKLIEYFYSATAELGENITMELRFMSNLEKVGLAIKKDTELHFEGYISGDREHGNWIVISDWELLGDYLVATL